MRLNLTNAVGWILIVSIAAFAVAFKQQPAQADNSVQVKLAAADTQPAAPSTAAQKPDAGKLDDKALRARGEYLANSVAMCVVCHSPKDDQGKPIQDKAFQGGVIPARPTYPKMEVWADHAPALGPLVGGAGDEVTELLQTGIWKWTGKSPRSPMPPFRFSEEDAKAVVAYLKSQNASIPVAAAK